MTEAAASAATPARRRRPSRRQILFLAAAILLLGPGWLLPCAIAARLALHPRPLERWVRFPPTLPTDHGSGFESFEVTTSDGVRLRGWWIPARGPRRGTIVGLPGFASPKTDWSSFAAIVGPRGWDLVLYDGRGTGESDEAQCTWGLRESRDLRDVLDALQSAGRDVRSVALVGTSMGAVTALRAAAEDPRVRAVIAQSPYLAVAGAWNDLLDPPWRRVLGLHRRTTWALVGAWSDEPGARDASLVGVMPHVRVPLLLVHGTSDAVVPVSHSRRLLELAAGAPKELLVVEGGEHVSLWHGPRSQEYRDRMLAFLDEHAAGAGSASAGRVSTRIDVAPATGPAEGGPTAGDGTE